MAEHTMLLRGGAPQAVGECTVKGAAPALGRVIYGIYFSPPQ